VTTRLAAILALSLAAAIACRAGAGGPPRIEVDRTACAQCGMLISEPMYAAAYRAPDAEARVFDDIACMLDAARREQNAGALRFWFHDAATSTWIDGGAATFVSSASLNTPMGGGFVAYKEEAAAVRAAEERHGTVIRTVDDLLRAPIDRLRAGPDSAGPRPAEGGA
jgi:copper chaperone NosL